MPPRRTNANAVLERVRVILAETCEQDGQPRQEVARRKAYRAGINRALATIDEAAPTKARGPVKETR